MRRKGKGKRGRIKGEGARGGRNEMEEVRTRMRRKEKL